MTRFLVYFTAYFALILFQLDSISAIPPRKSLFIQVNGWPTGISGLTALLDNVCLYHRNASGSLQYIENLVLDQIAIYDVNASKARTTYIRPSVFPICQMPMDACIYYILSQVSSACPAIF